MLLITLEECEKMSDDKKNEVFLASFKKLEAFLSRKAAVKDNFIPFSQALNIVYSKRMCGDVLNGENYDFLRSAAELRNVLSHNNFICFPTSQFLYKFLFLSDSLLYPQKSIDIATKYKNLLTCSLDDFVSDLIVTMNERGLTHVPVVENGRLIGVFSVSSFFDKALHGAFNYESNVRIKDFEDCLKDHSTERFIFVPPYVSAYSLKGMLRKNKSHERRPAVIFVTSDGTNKGNLLGLITETDLLKLEA